MIKTWPLALCATLAATPVFAQDKAPDTPVIVTGKPPAVSNKVDRKVYRMDSDIQATTGSAADVLGNIPSVEVDPDGNVSLRGDANVNILIDGKPVAQMQGASRAAALQSLSASDIRQIEVMTSPSAEFKPDGTGVINIVTKGRARKSSGSVLVNEGDGGRYNAGVAGTYATKAFALHGGLNVRNDVRKRFNDTQTASTQVGSEGTTVSHQTMTDTGSRKSGNIGIDLTPDNRRTFGISADYASRDEWRSGRQDSVSAGASNTAFTRFSRGGGPRVNTGMGLTFDQKLARPGESLSVALNLSQATEKHTYDFTTFSASDSEEKDYRREAYGVSELTVGYVRPVSGGTLKLGYDEEYDHNGFDDVVAKSVVPGNPLTVDHAFDNRFRYRQTIGAAYATLDRTFGKLEVLGGVRLEQVDVWTLQGVSGDTGTQAYGTVYPTLNATYALSDSDTLTAGFSKRVRRRDPEDLNPYINASDPNNLRQGNPKLKPEMTNALEVGYRHQPAGGGSYQVTAYYRKSRNGDTELWTVISSDVVLITEANLPSSQSGGVEFSASGKIVPKLGYSLNGNVFYNEINAVALGASTRSTIGMSMKASLDYQPTARDRWQVSTSYSGKRLTAQGYVLPVTLTNVGYRHQVADRLALVMTASDIFDGQRQKRLFISPGYTGTYVRRQPGRAVYLGLAWTLGGGKKAKDSDFTYDD
ncbi:TonB-dependent receptor domain-containing protein [Asticcacaulis solisilvae]|uniref:TonB-dependent receptor domain-containing protein n=1 Tax=Asticcacaulis solisilvae TaxID=1217274 RepID=UPI003FD8A83D